jgi:hypothetical protein
MFTTQATIAVFKHPIISTIKSEYNNIARILTFRTHPFKMSQIKQLTHLLLMTLSTVLLNQA